MYKKHRSLHENVSCTSISFIIAAAQQILLIKDFPHHGQHGFVLGNPRSTQCCLRDTDKPESSL